MAFTPEKEQSREFEVTLLSTPDHYLFSEAEIKSVYYNLIKHIKNVVRQNYYINLELEIKVIGE